MLRVLGQWLTLVWLLLASDAAAAKKLYKYQDEKGRWYFTDKAPTTRQPVEIRQLKPAPKRWVWLKNDGNLANPGFFLLNQYPGPVEVEIDWKQRAGLLADPALPHRFVVEQGESDRLFSVRAEKHNTPQQKFSLEYRYVVGQPLPGYAGQFFYVPPIAPGSRFRITQGFNGEFSHQDAQNRFAVDIMMPIDTPVYAARSGTVLEVDNDFFKGGTSQAYVNEANSIRILHDDGSMAVYAHLALEKALVHPGLQVKAGDLIAYSGNTGYSTGPHLHFVVQVNRGMELVSVPFQFAGEGRQGFEPKEGDWLQGIDSSLNAAQAQSQQRQ